MEVESYRKQVEERLKDMGFDEGKIPDGFRGDGHRLRADHLIVTGKESPPNDKGYHKLVESL
jgi:hypothetical protein